MQLGVCVIEPQPNRKFRGSNKPSTIGLPGTFERTESAQPAYVLRKCCVVDGPRTKKEYPATYHSLPDLYLAWQKRAQLKGAFARNPELRELVNVLSLANLAQAGEPGAVDLLLQVLCREGASDEPQRLASLPQQLQRLVAMEALLVEEALLSAAAPAVAPAAAPTAAAAAAPASRRPMSLPARCQSAGLRRTAFMLCHDQTLGQPFFVDHDYGRDTEQLLDYCAYKLCGAQKLVGGHCGAAQASSLQQRLEDTIAAEAAEVPLLKVAMPGYPHMSKLPLRQRSPLPPQPLPSQPLEVEHALSQFVCVPDRFHAAEHIGALPGYLNRVKGAGQWLTLALALKMHPEIVRPALQQDGWLEQHSEELSNWMVHQSGTVVTRSEWQKLPSPEVMLAQQYNELHQQYRSSHPEQPCACERCGGTLAARGERLLAQLHQELMVSLRQQAPPGASVLDCLRHGPQAFPISAGEHSLRLRLAAASCRTRLRRSGSVASPEQQQLTAEEALLEHEGDEQALADEECAQAAAPAAAPMAAAAAHEAAQDGGQVQLDAAQHSLGGRPANLAGLTRFLVSPVHEFLQDKCGVSWRSMPRALPRMLQLGIAAFLRPNDHQLLPDLEAESRQAAADFMAQHAQQQQPVARQQQARQQQVAQPVALKQQAGQQVSAEEEQEGQQHKKARRDATQQEEWEVRLIEETARRLDIVYTKQRMRQQGCSEEEIRCQINHVFGAGTM